MTALEWFLEQYHTPIFATLFAVATAFCVGAAFSEECDQCEE